MSDIFKTAFVQQLMSTRKERFTRAVLLFRRLSKEAGTGVDPEWAMQNFIQGVADIIEEVEQHCYEEMYADLVKVPLFDPDVEPKNCWHCKRMMRLRGDLCYGHLKTLGLIGEDGVRLPRPKIPVDGLERMVLEYDDGVTWGMHRCPEGVFEVLRNGQPLKGKFPSALEAVDEITEKRHEEDHPPFG